MNQQNVRQGVIFMLIASFCFALVGACTRILRDSISSVEIVFFRNLIGVVFIGYSVLKRPLVQVGGKPGLLVFRGVIGTIALYTFFYSITQIGLAEAITYQQTYPIFIAVFSVFIAGEGLRRNEWLAVLLGFGGICFIFIPQMSTGLLNTRSHVIGITNAVLTAFAYMSIRGLSAYYDGRSIVLSFMLSGILLPIISMGIGQFYDLPSLDFLVAAYVQPHGSDWLWILVLGIAAMIGQIYLTKAFSFGKAGTISAVGFSNIVFSVIFGIFLGDPKPSTLAFIGIAFVITSGIIISYQAKKAS
ncbi:DMT family transporter [Arcticibacterium luteifluviistationis]|uniref:EamA family transporter n=1 Tax=Arcticibacterium luteifluviistationis TaxID=1784714 RepID=A0A2Z4GF19_9BACT|nr:DMT family transporter [Arcticibacterium luteifluviistationis]AWV99647.1 EamA family transporter [Arcticibacterium luteifluviistationis]